jgi:hypothetical protein
MSNTTGSILLALSFLACNFLTPAAGQDVTSPDTASPEIKWSETQSPLLPVTWPPTADTVWVRYTFAYGSNPALLMDGNYVTNPLSKTEWKAGVESTIVLSEEMTQVAIQGMVPLDEETQKILDTESRVSEYCLNLTGLPDPNAPETQELLTYYRAWFKYNDTFLGLVRTDHADFIDWVTQEN